ncbi:MAG: beta-1,6-glucan synthase [Methyloceanibacter sp.]
MPPSPLAAGEKLTCLSYTPFHGDQAPFTEGLVIPDRQIESDLRELSEVTSCVRTYSADGPEGRVAALAGAHGLKVLQGIWLGRDLAENRLEVEAALKLAKKHPNVIQALIVGNETLLRGELSAAQVRAYINEVRERAHLRVTYADVWEFWLKARDLASAVDFVTIHILPYWEDHPVAAEDAVAHVRNVRRNVGQQFAGKDILIGEVGWPSAGRMREEALPSRANQALVLEGVVAAAKEEGWRMNLIEAFDQPWKRLQEGTVGGFWGLFDSSARTPKFRFGEPVSNHPHWRAQASLGIGAALLILIAYWLGGRTRPPSLGRDVAAACISLGSGLVFGWAAFGLTIGSMYPGDEFRDVGLLVLTLVAPMAAAYAVARGDQLKGFATVLDPSCWRRVGWVGWVLAAILVATVVAAIVVALGLVSDPRYKDFPVALLTAPVAALAILVFTGPPGHTAGVAEIAAAVVLAASAIVMVLNEGFRNWQALWLGALLIGLALTALRARAEPG